MADAHYRWGWIGFGLLGLSLGAAWLISAISQARLAASRSADL